jgi:zinc transport system substrate-binding protein
MTMPRHAIRAGIVVLVLSTTSRAVEVPPVIRVFVSIPPQKFLAQRIGRERVDVRVMLEPGYSPETFDPTPRRMADVAGADLYFGIGVPFENAWLPKLRRQNPGLRVVECCGQGDAAGADGGAEHGDPHVWVNPMSFMAAAHGISRALGARDAIRKGIYARNYRELSAELVMLRRDLRFLLRKRRIDEFIISHAALGPLADEFGLKQIAMETGGREMGPEALASLAALGRQLKIRHVFALPQHGQAQARALARELGAELVQIDPLAENYLDNMREIGRKLGAALQ